MKIITQTRLGLKKTYELNTKDIKITGRNCVGTNLHNLLKIPKTEIIIDVIEWTNWKLFLYYEYKKIGGS